MQCTSYLPRSYYYQDRNVVPSGGSWPMHGNNITLMHGQSYNSFYPPQNVDQFRVIPDNEVLRQTMLKHEFIFRDQVQQLHRLYRRQRELMNEIRRGELTDRNLLLTPESKFVGSKTSPGAASISWQTPAGPALASINPAAHALSTPSSASSLSTYTLLGTLPQTEISFKNQTFLQPKPEKPTMVTFDLELPADEYTDSEEVNLIGEKKGNEVLSNGPCSRNGNMNMMDFDLNMPPSLSIDSDRLETNAGNFIVSQVFPTPLDGVEVEESAKNQKDGVCEIKNKISGVLIQIDLNSCVDEDDPSPTLPISKPIESAPEIDLEAPVSPENKESSPPRGESEENLLETPAQSSKQEDSDSNENLVNTAAETMFLISKSCFNEKSKASLVESLQWFAGVVSSIANNLEIYEAGVSSDGSDDFEMVGLENWCKEKGRKEETECIVALPSQQGKSQRKRRRYRKNAEIEVFRTPSPLSQPYLGFPESCLKSWGKVNKRRRALRVRARSIRLLWNSGTLVMM